MGGGDLNSKKSWHPNTIKNQERVWKAEQAAAEEKKRISDLQREIAMERDKTDLKELAMKTSGIPSDDRLSWMYDKPDKKINQEDYLLGKTIDSNFDRTEKDQEAIPTVMRRVVGSSMLAAAGDNQVDLARKMREDPLLLVKERERAARAALLNNPLQRKKLTELLRQEQEKRKEKKCKKSKEPDNDLNEKLASKLNALGGKGGLDLAALLASDDSDSSSDEDRPKKKKEKKCKKSKKKKSKKSKRDEDNDALRKKKSKRDKDNDIPKKKKTSSHKSVEDKKSLKRTSRSSSEGPDSKLQKKEADRYRRPSEPSSRDRWRDHGDTRRQHATGRDRPENSRDPPENSRDPPENSRDRPEISRDRRDASSRRGLSDAERAARLAEMARAGAAHEQERGRRVAHQLQQRPEEPVAARPPRTHALPQSLEARIHSNRHNIQRNERHMTEHFARR